MTETSTTAGTETTIEPRIALRDGFWLLGMVSTGPFTGAHERITALWETLVSRKAELGLDRDADGWVSLCHGRETEFSCYIGVELPEAPVSVPDGMVVVEVLPHEYAVGTVHGTQESVDDVYRHLPAWVEAQGREWNRAILWIEAYPEPYREGQSEMHFEVWLPLV